MVLRSLKVKSRMISSATGKLSQLAFCQPLPLASLHFLLRPRGASGGSGGFLALPSSEGFGGAKIINHAGLRRRY